MFLIGSKCDGRFLQQEQGRGETMVWKASPFTAKRFSKEEADRKVNDWNSLSLMPEGNYFVIDERSVSVEGKRITEDDREQKIERIEAIVGTLNEMPWHDVPGPELTRLYDHIVGTHARLEAVIGYAKSRKAYGLDQCDDTVADEMVVVLDLAHGGT